jgi:hypothetical protein
MKLWHVSLTVILATIVMALSGCGPSQAEIQAQLEAQRQQAEAQQQLKAQERERKGILAWVTQIDFILVKDALIISEWNDFIGTPTRRNPQEEGFNYFVKEYDALLTRVSGLTVPTQCQKANQLLVNYLSMKRPIVKYFLLYYQDYSNPYVVINVESYRIEANDLISQKNQLRQQFYMEFDKIRLLTVPPPPAPIITIPPALAPPAPIAPVYIWILLVSIVVLIFAVLVILRKVKLPFRIVKG